MEVCNAISLLKPLLYTEEPRLIVTVHNLTAQGGQLSLCRWCLSFSLSPSFLFLLLVSLFLCLSPSLSVHSNSSATYGKKVNKSAYKVGTERERRIFFFRSLYKTRCGTLKCDLYENANNYFWNATKRGEERGKGGVEGGVVSL